MSFAETKLEKLDADLCKILKKAGVYKFYKPNITNLSKTGVAFLYEQRYFKFKDIFCSVKVIIILQQK